MATKDTHTNMKILLRMPLLKTKLSLLLFFCSIFTIHAQNKIIYFGSPNTRGAELHLKKDNTYKIVVKEGNYKKIKFKENEYLFLENIDYENPGFKVCEDYSDITKDSITINFYRRNFDSEYKDIYIGFKPKQQNDFTYLNLSYETLLFNTKNIKPFDFRGNLSFKIPRTEEIQLIIKKDKKYHLDQFILSNNADNVYVDYRQIRDKENIENNSKLIIAEINRDGKLEINKNAFSTDFAPSSYVNHTISDSFSDWEIPLLLKKQAYKKFNNPKYQYQPVITISPSPRNEEFKEKEFKNLKEAISALKKDDSKILLIFNSLLAHNDIAHYHFIYDKVHENSKLEYLSEYYLDKYLLYYIQAEDLVELKKYRPESISEVIALNSNLDIVYTENISTNNFYNKYNSIDEELSQNIIVTNLLLQFEKKIKTHKLTAKDFLELGKWRYHKIIDLAIEKRQKDDDELIIESSNTPLESQKKQYRKFKTKVEYNYPTINYKELRQELNLLVEKHKNDQSIDFDYAELALDFISVNPFFDEITGEKGNYMPTKIYYEFCLYLSRFPVETSKIKNSFTQQENDHYFTITDILEKEGTKKEHPDLIISIFENLIQAKDFKYQAIFYYYIYLYNQDRLTYEKYDQLINEIVPQEGNFKEQIKSFYDHNPCPYIDNLEYYLSTLSNAMAWKAVYKNTTDKTLLKKAVRWSKISTYISPSSHFYFDTQANLEYFLGNKEQAIKLESKAIQLAVDSHHKNVTEYKNTLVKIQTNTLKY